MSENFNYAEEFKSLDYNALKKDLAALMTTRRTGGPPTSGTTVRFSFAWPGTAPVLIRTFDGRGGGGRGQQRFAPLKQLARQRKPRSSAAPALAD